MSKLNCRGIGVVIDDRVPMNDGEQGEDAIGDIVRQLKEDGISLLKYRELPPESEWDNFGGVAFLLIDWSLLGEEVGSGAKQLMAKRVCDFIKAVHRKAFAPIFVFSNQDETDIENTLKENKIETDVPSAYVLIKPKAEMKTLGVDGSPMLFNEINKWILATPAIRLFATWGNDVLTARNQMFAEFYDKGHNWPSLLWKAYKDDNDDPAHGLSQVMFDNLKARIRCDLPEMPNVEHDEKSLMALRDVLALTVMLPAEVLPENQIGCGDLFETAPDEMGQRYYLIVSCDCDCVSHSEQSGTKQHIQTLEVNHPLSQNDSKIRDRINPDRGYKHKATESYLFPIDGMCFKVNYRSLKLFPKEDFDLAKRKGRVLSPYITDIRQRLAQWNQRVGFPKLPSELFR